MKTLKETLELANELVMRGTDTHDTCMMNYAGHVNRLDINIYPLGYDRKDMVDSYNVYSGYLNTENEINLAYFCMKVEIEKYK